MRDFFSSVKFKIIVCIFALVLGVVIYAAVSGGFSTIPETVITTITKPFVEASNAISNWVATNGKNPGRNLTFISF